MVHKKAIFQTDLPPLQRALKRKTSIFWSFDMTHFPPSQLSSCSLTRISFDIKRVRIEMLLPFNILTEKSQNSCCLESLDYGYRVEKWEKARRTEDRGRGGEGHCLFGYKGHVTKAESIPRGCIWKRKLHFQTLVTLNSSQNKVQITDLTPEIICLRVNLTPLINNNQDGSKSVSNCPISRWHYRPAMSTERILLSRNGCGVGWDSFPGLREYIDKKHSEPQRKPG